MSSFKFKNDRNKANFIINTLDEKHKNMVQSFQSKKKDIPKKKNKLIKYKKELDNLEKIKNSVRTDATLNNKAINDDFGRERINLIKSNEGFDCSLIKRRAELKTLIKELEQNIYDIENDLTELDYYSRTEDIIMDYYDIMEEGDEILYNENPELCQEKKKDITEKEYDILEKLKNRNLHKKKIKKFTKKRKRKSNSKEKKSILNYLTGNTKKIESSKKKEKSTEQENPSIINSNRKNEEQDATKKLKKNKAELLDQYLTLIDNEYYCNKKKKNTKFNICPYCSIEKTLIHSEGTSVCPECGEAEMVIIDSEKPNYKEAVTDSKPIFAYKRSNHLNEWISQFQAKESTEIPEEVYVLLIAELQKNRIFDMKKLEIKSIKPMLKKLGLTQYYEHTTHIYCKLSGKNPPTINRETEEQVRFMFRQIQAPFEKHCPKTRTNFLSYSYVLHKIFQLLELDDCVKCFPLLKSREKLRQQDLIWKNICEDLRWSFIKSV